MKTLYDRLKDKQALEEVKKEFSFVGMEIEYTLKNNINILSVSLKEALSINIFLTTKPFDLEAFENLFD